MLHEKELLSCILLFIYCMPGPIMSVCFKSSGIRCNGNFRFIQCLFNLLHTDLCSCHINKSVQHRWMAFYHIILIQILPLIDIFRDFDMFCPVFVLPGKSAVIRKFPERICHNKRHTLFSKLLQHLPCGIFL